MTIWRVIFSQWKPFKKSIDLAYSTSDVRVEQNVNVILETEIVNTSARGHGRRLDVHAP